MKIDARGFTLIEIIAILAIIGILGAVAANRLMNLQSVNAVVAADILRNRIRFAQSMAMKSCSFESAPGEKCRGIKCIDNTCWLFIGNDPDNGDRQMRFPGEQAVKIPVSDASGITVTPFTVYFDVYGIPYTAFTNANSNTRLAAPLRLSVGSETLTLLPETGFIQ